MYCGLAETRCITYALYADIKLHLSQTDYGDFLANEPSPIHTTTIAEHATLKLVQEFYHLRLQAVEPLATFMDYITYVMQDSHASVLTLFLVMAT